MATTRDRIKSTLAAIDYTKRNTRKLIPAVLGNNSGTVEVTTDELEWVWVRLRSDPNQVVRAYMATAVEPLADLAVEVEWVESVGYVIRGVATAPVYISNPWTGSVPAHAAQHERADLGQGGFDPVENHIRSIPELRAQQTVPASLSLYVVQGRYIMNGLVYVMPTTTTSAISAPAGANESRIDLLYIDTAQTLQWVTGVAVVTGGFVSPARPAAPSAGCLPLAYVTIANGQTTLEEDDIEDARVPWTVSGAGAVTAHNVLSATHSDTLTASVVDGDVIIGNATPKWSRLSISIPTANTRNVLGIDNGELRPSWKIDLDLTRAIVDSDGNIVTSGGEIVWSY